MEIGVNSNNECGKDLDEIYTNIKQAGIDNVMVAFNSGNGDDAIKKALAHGLNIPFVHLKTRFAGDLWIKGPTNKEYVEDVIEQLKLCSKYNIPIAVMHATSGDCSLTAWNPSTHALDSMRTILSWAKKLKVKIALENLDRPNFKHFKYILDNIDSPWLGFCYDAGHHNLYCPHTDLLKRYGDRILAVHLHDNYMDWVPGMDWSQDMHFLPFDGKLDYDTITKKLAKTPYNNVVMLELHKDCFGEKEKYGHLTPRQYLGKAKERADKIAAMIDAQRKK